MFPICINQMDPQASNSLESRERAVSSEPCSTRPNPFDDGDTTSRKRRRTSRSGPSRSRSADSVTSSQDQRQTSADELSLGTDSATMKDDTDPVTPQTPEQKPPASQPTPRSNRVTINVRTPSRPLDPIALPPPVSEEPIQQGPTADMLLDDDVKISVEETEVDMANTGTPAPQKASSDSETSSPPIELIALDQEDDLEYGSAQPQVTLLHGAHANVLADPTADFPFHEATESLQETVARLTSFMFRKSLCRPIAICCSLTQSPPHQDDTVAKSLSDWIRNYIAFAKVTDHYTIWQSYRQYHDLWHSIPELVNYTVMRR